MKVKYSTTDAGKTMSTYSRVVEDTETLDQHLFSTLIVSEVLNEERPDTGFGYGVTVHLVQE